MICQFSFRNYKSYRKETTFDFQAAAIPEFAESLLTCKAENKDNKIVTGSVLLPVGVVYGPNGGGKSNLLRALSFLITTVVKPINDDEQYDVDLVVLVKEPHYDAVFAAKTGIQHWSKGSR